MRRIGLACLVFLVAACAPRAGLFLAPDLADSRTIETILVASTREFSDGNFTNDRREGLGFSRFGIGIPPVREQGEISQPTPPVDPDEDFVVTSAELVRDAAGFRQLLAADLATRPRGAREVMIFVHGFNNTFADGLYRTAQIRHDFEVPGVAVHYSWASTANPFGYAYDRDSALIARDGLEDLLSLVTDAGAETIILLAHSLGSQLTMESLRQLRIGGRTDILNRVRGVILMSPDIDVEVFRSQAMRLSPLPQPFVIFTSRRDRALALSARITGQGARLGNLGTVEDVADLEVTLVDVSEFRGGSGDRFNHFTAASSPAMIRILGQAQAVNAAFEGDPSGQAGLLPGTVLTVRNATQVVLNPVLAGP